MKPQKENFTTENTEKYKLIQPLIYADLPVGRQIHLNI